MSREKDSLLTKIMQSGQAVKRRVRDLPGQLGYQISTAADFPEKNSVNLKNLGKNGAALDKEKLQQQIAEAAMDAPIPGGGGLAGMFKGQMASTFDWKLANEAIKLKNWVVQNYANQGKKLVTKNGGISLPTYVMSDIANRTGTFQTPWDPKTWWQYDPKLFGTMELRPEVKKLLADLTSSKRILYPVDKIQLVSGPAAKLLKADDLFKNYPDMANAKLDLNYGAYGGNINFARNNPKITATSNTVTGLENILSHEFMHNIQQVESAIGQGFSPSAVGAKEAAEELHRLSPALAPANALKVAKTSDKKLSPELLQLKRQAVHNVYAREGGEVQARTAEALNHYLYTLDRAGNIVKDTKNLQPIADLNYDDFIRQITQMITDPVALNQIWINK